MVGRWSAGAGRQHGAASPARSRAHGLGRTRRESADCNSRERLSQRARLGSKLLEINDKVVEPLPLSKRAALDNGHNARLETTHVVQTADDLCDGVEFGFV